MLTGRDASQISRIVHELRAVGTVWRSAFSFSMDTVLADKNLYFFWYFI